MRVRGVHHLPRLRRLLPRPRPLPAPLPRRRRPLRLPPPPGLWALQTGLTLYVEAFVPEGCHVLLDLPEPSTRCDLEESKMQAAALLDLAFALHSAFVAAVVLVAYVAAARDSGPAAAAAAGIGGLRRSNGASYEALPTSSASTGTLADLDHVQMKAIGKSRGGGRPGRWMTGWHGRGSSGGRTAGPPYRQGGRSSPRGWNLVADMFTLI